MVVKQILFLCSGNYYRSRFAEELFNFRVLTISGDWIANSRGLNLNVNNRGPMAESAVTRMKSLGINPVPRYPLAAITADFEKSTRVIAMSRQEHYPLMRLMFPKYADSASYWDVEDTDQMSADIAFSRVELLVSQLVEDVQRG